MGSPVCSAQAGAYGGGAGGRVGAQVSSASRPQQQCFRRERASLDELVREEGARSAAETAAAQPSAGLAPGVDSCAGAGRALSAGTLGWINGTGSCSSGGSVVRNGKHHICIQANILASNLKFTDFVDLSHSPNHHCTLRWLQRFKFTLGCVSELLRGRKKE